MKVEEGYYPQYGAIEEIQLKKKGERINILTHCNARWLVDIPSIPPEWQSLKGYNRKQGRGVHLLQWVDETRPRNQGARLTAWELSQHNIPHTIIPDNVGGPLR